MDRGDVESDRWLLRAFARLHQLLRYANGGALAGHGNEKNGLSR
jgi:hypothetical protein